MKITRSSKLYISHLDNITHGLSCVLLIEYFGSHAALLIANRRKNIASLATQVVGRGLFL